jgi:hypothetical protein
MALLFLLLAYNQAAILAGKVAKVNRSYEQGVWEPISTMS